MTHDLRKFGVGAYAPGDGSYFDFSTRDDEVFFVEVGDADGNTVQMDMAPDKLRALALEILATLAADEQGT